MLGEDPGRDSQGRGQKKGEGAFVKGQRDGAWTWWRPDGTVWRAVVYQAGREVKKP